MQGIQEKREMTYLVPKELKAKPKINENIYVFDFIILSIFAGLTYFLSSAVSGALTLPFYVFSAIAIIWLISPSPKDAHRPKWQEITILLKKLLDDNEYKMVRNETERIGRQ